jgi:6-phospho-beta-glucosidase
VFGVIPNSYLQYFYDTERKVEQQSEAPTRAEVVMGIEAELLREYADPALTGPPPGLLKRGGAHYATVATQLITSHHNDLGETHIVNVRNGSAVGAWDPSWVLELPARVGRAGITPLPAEPLSPGLAALLIHVKMYELLTVEAAVTADRDIAWQALVTNPLGPRPAAAQRVVDELLDINRSRLPAAWAIGR